jgi:hypothetical protein
MTLPTIITGTATSKQEEETTTMTTSMLTTFDEIQIKVFGPLQKESQPERKEYNMLMIRIKDVSDIAEEDDDDDDEKEQTKTSNRTPIVEIVNDKTNNSTTNLNFFDLQSWEKGTGGLRNTDRVLLSQIYSKANSIFEFVLGESTYIAAHMQKQKRKNQASTDNNDNFISSNFMYVWYREKWKNLCLTMKERSIR